jgi:hypothetical protein
VVLQVTRDLPENLEKKVRREEPVILDQKATKVHKVHRENLEIKD